MINVKNAKLARGNFHSDLNSYVKSEALAFGALIWGKGYAYDWSPLDDMSSSVITPRSDATLEFFLEGPEGKCLADWKCKFRPQFSIYVYTDAPASAEVKGRMGIRAETFNEVCGETIAVECEKCLFTCSYKLL